MCFILPEPFCTILDYQKESHCTLSPWSHFWGSDLKFVARFQDLVSKKRCYPLSICGQVCCQSLVCYSPLINRFPDYGALTDLSDQLYPMEDKVCSQSVKTRSKRYVWKNGKELKFPVFRLFNWSILWWRQMVFILQSAKIWSPDDYSMVQLTIWPSVAKPFYHIQYPVNSKTKYVVTKTISLPRHIIGFWESAPTALKTCSIARIHFLLSNACQDLF